jgi:hypothetical protein
VAERRSPTDLEEAFSEVRVLERLGQPLGSAHTSQQKKIARISRKAEVAHKELHIHASGLSPWSNTTPTMKPLNTATDVKRPRQNIHKAKPAYFSLIRR